MTLVLLKSPFLDNRILAINTLGNLGQENAYAEIEKLLRERDPIISSWAWRALFRINPETTLHKHLGLIADREDWSPIFVAKVLQEIEADTISEPLCRLVEESYRQSLEERQMSRLISYLVLAHVSDRTAVVNRILLESDEMEVLIACLRLVNSDDDLTRIRALIKDTRWEVRLQVVLTLGRLGHDEDVELLIGALDDPDWWVRYRTASVLFSMPGVTEERLESLAETLPNPFARDILRQVLNELRLLCYTQSTLTLSR
jgi:HEAT repeat protein